MIIEIEIEENSNIFEYEYRTFMGKGKNYPIDKTMYFPEDGSSPFEVNIIGWKNAQPVQAYALCIEDSGDGEAWLIYGGNHGLRLRDVTDQQSKFSISHSNEWGEKYLCYHKNLYPKVIEPYIKAPSDH